MSGARDGQLKINRGTDDPSWTLLIWDDGLQDYRDLHGADGADGATGPAGPNVDATTSTVGSVLIDQAPLSGSPVAVTTPRIAAASGICDLDSSTHVPLSRLSGITHSQLDSAAGLLAAQIAAVNPSVLTGSGTVPRAALPTAASSVVQQLDYVPNTDAGGPLTLTSNTWVDLYANQSFTVDLAASLIAVSISGMGQLQGANPGTSVTLRLMVDSAGASTTKLIGGAIVPDATTFAVNVFSGIGIVTFTGLSAGSHTIKVQAFSGGHNSNLYLRPATNSSVEFMALRVLECKPALL